MTRAKSIHESTGVENVSNGQVHAVLLLSYVAFSSYFYAKGGKFLFCSARPHRPPRVERARLHFHTLKTAHSSPWWADTSRQ